MKRRVNLQNRYMDYVHLTSGYLNTREIEEAELAGLFRWEEMIEEGLRPREHTTIWIGQCSLNEGGGFGIRVESVDIMLLKVVRLLS